MEYLIWSSPVVCVVALIASGRSTVLAGGVGVLGTILAALLVPARDTGFADLLVEALAGAWFACLVGAVILGGLFFREILATEGKSKRSHLAVSLDRRTAYSTCFLVGPFAESATGFGVGQVEVTPRLRQLGVKPIDAVVLGLFSQVMVPWGALANPTIVGAGLAGLPPVALGADSALLTAPLLFLWLALYWRAVKSAGVPSRPADLIVEFLMTLVVAGLLVAGNVVLGPEVAVLAALGPVIALRFLGEPESLADKRQIAISVGLPYAFLIIGLAASRLVPPLNTALGNLLVFRPLPHWPEWHPFLHPSSWLVGVGVLTAMSQRDAARIPAAAVQAWRRCRWALLALMLFLAMARVLLASGIASEMANGMRLALGSLATLLTPLLAGLFGFLTGNGSATNGLLMPAQVALATSAHISLPWLAAVQNVAAAALTMLSPVRVSIGCSLAGIPSATGDVYRRAWLFGTLPLVALLASAALLLAMA